MDPLVILSQDDGSDVTDGERRRPTPLDPEYWQGITHSFDATPYPHALEELGLTYNYVPSAGAPAASGGGYALIPSNNAYGGAAPINDRPITAPAAMAAYGGIVPSPIHYQSVRPLPISPMITGGGGGFGGDFHGGNAYRPATHSGAGFARSGDCFDGVDPGFRGYEVGGGGSKSLKEEFRYALMRAQAFLSLTSLFQSYDPSGSGVIPLHSVQEALTRMSVVLSNSFLRAISQLFGVPGSSMIDYIALSRFVELDAQEMYVIGVLLCWCNGDDFTQSVVFLTESTCGP